MLIYQPYFSLLLFKEILGFGKTFYQQKQWSLGVVELLEQTQNHNMPTINSNCHDNLDNFSLLSILINIIIFIPLHLWNLICWSVLANRSD